LTQIVEGLAVTPSLVAWNEQNYSPFGPETWGRGELFERFVPNHLIHRDLCQFGRGELMAAGKAAVRAPTLITKLSKSRSGTGKDRPEGPAAVAGRNNIQMYKSCQAYRVSGSI
jgi:hypothetical protein